MGIEVADAMDTTEVPKNGPQPQQQAWEGASLEWRCVALNPLARICLYTSGLLQREVDNKLLS